MNRKLEIYLRYSSNRALLMFHVREADKKSFLDALKRGEVARDDLEMNLELSVQPEWIADKVEREKFIRSGCHVHIRVPLTAITASYLNDDE